MNPFYFHFSDMPLFEDVMNPFYLIVCQKDGKCLHLEIFVAPIELDRAVSACRQYQDHFPDWKCSVVRIDEVSRVFPIST